MDNNSGQIFPSVDIWSSNSDNLKFGDKLEVVGFPAIGGSTITYTSGDFSGFGSPLDGTGNYIKATVPLEHGNSGGAAYDSQGEYIGIPSMVIAGSLNSLSYILSINSIKQWLSGEIGSTFKNVIIEQKSVIQDKDIMIRPGFNAPIAGTCAVKNYGGTAYDGYYTSTDSTIYAFTVDNPLFFISNSKGGDGGIQGYYFYFGKNINAKPEKDGRFSTTPTFQANVNEAGLYYLKYSAKDTSGNISDTEVCPYLFNKDGFFPQRLDIYNNQSRGVHIHSRFETPSNTISPTTLNTERRSLFLDWSNNNLNGINGYYFYVGDKDVISNKDLQDFQYTKNPYTAVQNLHLGRSYVYIVSQYDNNYKSPPKYLVTLNITEKVKGKGNLKKIKPYFGYIIKDKSNKYYYVSNSGILYDFRANENEILPLIKKNLAVWKSTKEKYIKRKGDFYIESDNLFYVKDNSLSTVKINTLNDMKKYIKSINFNIYEFVTNEDLSTLLGLK